MPKKINWAEPEYYYDDDARHDECVSVNGLSNLNKVLDCINDNLINIGKILEKLCQSQTK